MNKQISTYLHNGILLVIKKNTIDTCYNIEWISKYCVKWNKKHKRVRTVWVHLYDVLGKAKPTVKEIRKVAGLGKKDVQELSRREHEGTSRWWK